MVGNPGLQGTMRSEWNFDDTIRGTMRGGQVQLDLAKLSEDDDDDEDTIDWNGRLGADSLKIGRERYEAASHINVSHSLEKDTEP